ncbi:hypothetical protein SAMN05660649_04345 [Desulfotomaculum arcticum]|uniref:Bacteriophage T4 Gp32 single-stranded DNA-binding domain-containing protein n=1 Tax=Desulfotruncus arcticus DSM 17038 TaxID=1121424 RepID=A0A1I2YA35_9FIRM|nr:hypothetical protein [Desulfotruncus arcticus]SFH22628.1 hypothetical protein SAMN05660649_04345 [Desulfotomaculum arcticum] [Desulfotruncus arcticus DSM 17038]
MSVITARGQAAGESAKKKAQSVDFKKVYIRLKDGDSVRVRLLSPIDYVEYKAHGDYGLGIYTQPCTDPASKKCALCEAANSGLEEFEKLYARKRYLFAMADIDDGTIRIFDATKGQAANLIDTIESYKDDLGEVAFTFKRTGNKMDTVYSLNPILKLKAQDKEKWANFDGQVVDDEFFDTVLNPRSREQQLEDLAKAGFPINQLEDVPSFETEEAKPILMMTLTMYFKN